VSEQRRAQAALSVLMAGAVIGAVEAVLAVSFAALVYGGYLDQFRANGVGLYLLAAVITMVVFALRGGRRGVVGSVQDAAAAVLAVVAAKTAVGAYGSPYRSFLSVVAVTIVVTLATGVTFLALGSFRLGNLVRFVPYPVVGGFLAGTGWLLAKGGIGVAGSTVIVVSATGLRQLIRSFELIRWVPAVVFGVALVAATRVVKRPLVIPAVLGSGFVLFVIGMLVTGSSINGALSGGWMLGPFPQGRLLQPWTFRALTGADWTAVLDQVGGIATAVFVAVIAALFNMGGIELLLRKDLDTNRELRDAGLANIAAGPFGGIPAYHALSLTSLAQRLRVGARAAGLVAALVPLTAIILGSALVELIPRMIVGGVLVFIGLSFIVEWVWDARRSLPLGEYAIVLAILVTIAVKGFLAGVELGLVLALALFAINYSRIELVREVEFGSTYRSNVDRPPAERLSLEAMADHVQILRVSGFVFFGTARGLLERIRRRVGAGPLRFLLLDLRRVTGMDSSAVLSFRKVAQLAEANGFELVFSAVRDPVLKQLQRGGVVSSDGVVRFEQDLDHALQRCEDNLLAADARFVAVDGSTEALVDLPAGLLPYLERRSVPEGTALIHQGAQPDDLFVLESGRLRVELTTPEGTRMRLRSVRAGVVVGEVALFTGVPRTADVVAETPSVVLRLSRSSIQRIEAEDPGLAAALHRWLAKTLAERLSDSMRAYDALLD
jgi:SulP family sulfate permease